MFFGKPYRIMAGLGSRGQHSVNDPGLQSNGGGKGGGGEPAEMSQWLGGKSRLGLGQRGPREKDTADLGKSLELG